MVTSVNTNINAMAAVEALTALSNQMTTTQSAIESGNKINTASDNPAVFTIAQGLRGNIQALQAVSDSLSTGIATVQAQTQGATSISDQLNTLLQTVTQAQGETGAALASSNASIKNQLANIDAYANASTINGTNLLAGSGGTLNVLSNINGSTTSVTTTGATASDLGLTGLTVNSGGVTLATNATPIANADNVSYTANGQTTIFEFTDGSAPLTSTPGANTTVVGVNMGATDAVSMSNLLSAMQSHGVASTMDTSGVITVSGGTSTTASALTTGTAGNGTQAIAAVNAAIVNIGSTLSALGAATQQLQGLSDFTSQLSGSTSTALGAMVDANLSQESAQLSSLQTKQSLTIQSLSLANQGPSALLQLFR